GERARPLLRRQGARPVSRQQLPAARRRGCRVPHHPLQDLHFPGAGTASHHLGAGEEAPRAGAGDRPDRLGQEHDAGVDHRQDQHRAARAHRHRRGPDRVPAPAQELRGEPARGRGGYAQLQEGAQVHPAAGPGRGAGGRDARPRDHRGRAGDLRDRPPRLRDAAHQLLRPDHQPHPRRVPALPAAADPRPALLRARGSGDAAPHLQGDRPGPVEETAMATAPATATKTAPKAIAAPKLPIWVWEGKTKAGEVKKGEVEAADEASVQQRLRAMALTNVKIKKKPIRISLKIPGLGGISQKDLVIFTRQFATMIDAGLPLVQCLDILAGQLENMAFREVLVKVKTKVESGSTLADALGDHPKVFDTLYVQLVAAGEIGGILDTILNRLAAYIEKNEKLKSKVKGAMVYPSVVLVVAVGVCTVLLLF